MVRGDGFVVVMARGMGKTNGASIPWIVQPILGSPLEGLNPWWSCHHDGGYNGSALVFDLRGISFRDMCWMAEHWRVELAGMYQPHKWPKRKWWDQGMLAAMKEVGEPRIKQWLAYRAVRVGGWLPWRRARKS